MKLNIKIIDLRSNTWTFSLSFDPFFFFEIFIQRFFSFYFDINQFINWFRYSNYSSNLFHYFLRNFLSKINFFLCTRSIDKKWIKNQHVRVLSSWCVWQLLRSSLMKTLFRYYRTKFRKKITSQNFFFLLKIDRMEFRHIHFFVISFNSK